MVGKGHDYRVDVGRSLGTTASESAPSAPLHRARGLSLRPGGDPKRDLFGALTVRMQGLFEIPETHHADQP